MQALSVNHFPKSFKNRPSMEFLLWHCELRTWLKQLRSLRRCGFAPWPSSVGEGSGIDCCSCSIGCSCSSDSIPGLGTSIFCRCIKKQKQKHKKTKNKTENKQKTSQILLRTYLFCQHPLYYISWDKARLLIWTEPYFGILLWGINPLCFNIGNVLYIGS